MNASGLTRAFVAVVPPADVCDAIEAHLGDVNLAGWKASRPEQWHLTLEFLGRVDDVEREVARLRDAVADVAPFALRLGGAGAFPDVAHARVVWLGVTEGARDLSDLADAVRTRHDDSVDAALPGGGDDAMANDADEPFVAHLTVARTNRPRDATDLVGRLGAHGAHGAPRVGPAWTVDAVELIASDTHPDGARYRSVASLIIGTSSSGDGPMRT